MMSEVAKNQMEATEFKYWELAGPSTVAAIFDGCRRGIYILHFDNGERYVVRSLFVTCLLAAIGILPSI